MNLFFVFAAEAHDTAHSTHWLWPEPAELIFGTAASVLVFGALFYMLRKPVAKYFGDRTRSIQGELDAAVADKAAAEKEAAEIRSAAGDIDAERKRLFDEADAEAEALLAEGRARLADEVIELEARADADIASAAGRTNDELAGEIARMANRATEAALAQGIIDDTTQQELIENYISRVGQGVTS